METRSLAINSREYEALISIRKVMDNQVDTTCLSKVEVQFGHSTRAFTWVVEAMAHMVTIIPTTMTSLENRTNRKYKLLDKRLIDIAVSRTHQDIQKLTSLCCNL